MISNMLIAVSWHTLQNCNVSSEPIIEVGRSLSTKFSRTLLECIWLLTPRDIDIVYTKYTQPDLPLHTNTHSPRHLPPHAFRLPALSTTYIQTFSAHIQTPASTEVVSFCTDRCNLSSGPQNRAWMSARPAILTGDKTISLKETRSCPVRLHQFARLQKP